MVWVGRLLGVAACISCTTVLGINEEYRARDDGTAGVWKDAAGGDGGFGGSGGAGAGATGSGGLGGAACPEGEKRCQGSCVPPAPLVGCSLEGCDPCGAPPDYAVAVCDGVKCSHKCIPEATASGEECIPNASGGSGGTAGAAGASSGGAGSCDPSCPVDGGCNTCPGCLLTPGCCLADGRCGGWVSIIGTPIGACLPCPGP